MTGRSPQTDYAYYGCNKGVRSRTPDVCNGGYCPAPGIEEACWGLVEELAANPAAISLYADRTERQELPRWRREIKHGQKALDDLNFEEELAAKAYRKGVNTLERYEKDLTEIRQERIDLTATVERLTQLVGDAEAKAATVNRVRAIIGEFADKLDTLATREKRALLKRLMFRVTITPDEGNSQAKKGQRCFEARIEWAGEVFARSEASIPTDFQQGLNEYGTFAPMQKRVRIKGALAR